MIVVGGDGVKSFLCQTHPTKVEFRLYGGCVGVLTKSFHKSGECSMVFTREDAAEKDRQEEVQSYREAFDHYDWNRNGRVAVKVSPPLHTVWFWVTFL